MLTSISRCDVEFDNGFTTERRGWHIARCLCYCAKGLLPSTPVSDPPASGTAAATTCIGMHIHVFMSPGSRSALGAAPKEPGVDPVTYRDTAVA